MTLNTLPFIGIATATIISVLANPVTPYGSSYLSTFSIAHTHTHWCFITGYTSSTHTYKHVGGRNSLVAFQDGIYLQTSIYTKTQLNKCFACKSLNNRIGCMNTVELHQYGVGIFFLMRWMKKYTHTHSVAPKLSRKRVRERARKKSSSSSSLWFNIFKWLTLSAYELELEVFECECRRQQRFVVLIISFFHRIQFLFDCECCKCVCVSCHIFFFFFSILTTMFLLLLLFLSLLFYCR